MLAYREKYEDDQFVAPMLERVKREYQRAKLYLSRAEEAVNQLGLEPVVRMADRVYVSEYGSMEIYLQGCQRPWLIPVLTELDLPWQTDWMLLEGYVLRDTVQRDGTPLVTNKYREVIAHKFVLFDAALRKLGVNGRKSRPITTLQLTIYGDDAVWVDDEVKLPDGCVCTREYEADVSHVVHTCRMRS